MQLRVTLQSRALQMRDAIQSRGSDVQRTQEEVTTGRRLLRPSDDPVAARQALLHRAQLAQIEQYKSNIDLSIGDLNAADSFLDDVNLRITRAKEVAIQMGSDANSPGARKAAAFEIDALIDDLIALGNSSFRGRSIFAGENTTAAAFTRSGDTVTYHGTDTGAQRRIAEDTPLVETTIPASQFLFSTRDASNVVTDGIFRTLATLKTALNANDANAIRDSIQSLTADQSRVQSARTVIGGRTERVQQTRVRLENTESEIRSLQSTIEDADLAESISEMQLRQTALQATLGVASQTIPLSLMDLLTR
ncbi:flagellar hook-associated protein 3 [Candidatus Poribacteria bacterium]|nr:flagellar hook-associated protein 3 [Candidatus Poribacteria bacterium]